MLEVAAGDHLFQPTCSKQGEIEQVAQDRVQLGYEYLQGWSLHQALM